MILDEKQGLTNPRYKAPTPSFFAIFPISMKVHPILDPEGADWALDFQTSAGVFRAVPGAQEKVQQREREGSARFSDARLLVFVPFARFALTNESSDSSGDEVITKFLSLGLRG